VKILSRYVLREHLGPLTFALTALTSLLLLNFMAKRFGDLVGKGLHWSVIAEFFALAVPFTVAMTLPMAVLVSVLYAFSRLASESEITALKASGVPMRRLMVPVLAGATVLALLMVFFNDMVLPAANHRLRTLQSDIGRTKPTFALREQVVNEVVPGRLMLRATRIDKARSILHDVVIYDFADGTKRRTIVADSGFIELVAGTGDLALVLYHGTMTEIPTNDPTQLSRLGYTTDRVLVRGVANSFQRDSNDSYKSEREMRVCEMQAQVYSAERDMYAERRGMEAILRRATRALTRGVVDSLPRRDSLRTPSVGIGRLYCDATTAIATMLGRGPVDSSNMARRGMEPRPGEQPILVPGDTANGRTVNAGVPPTPAPSTGATLAPADRPRDASLAAITSPPLTPSAVATGLSPMIDQVLARAGSARSTWAQYEVEIHKKFSLSIACVVFVLIGAPIALRFPRGGVGLVIGASLGVFALYYVCLIGGESMADDLKLPPWVAMWAANLIFTVVGIVMFLRMGREGTTARGGDLDEVKEKIVAWFQSLRRSRAAVDDASPSAA
jgi:lipopolysaccharide export system permease protein